ncbi:MAG TPA: DUF3037 domain-containing protein [Solirubrobacteraceae bacterium]|nr:DUF3037 domain-containing protein [Solirubrobacteraceae bacterium]
MPAADVGFAYAILRVVPRVERGERLNVGVVVFCRQLEFLDLRTEVDEQRLSALAPELDLAEVRASLDAIRRVVCGQPDAGALAALPASERFGWLVAPASTVIQPSDVHGGLTRDPRATLERLFDALVSTHAT